MAFLHCSLLRRGGRQTYQQRIFFLSSNRRWFCRAAAIYYLRLFPTHAIETPHPLAPREICTSPIRLAARRKFGRQPEKGDSTNVISALQNLVRRLEEWEPNLALPANSQVEAEENTTKSNSSPFADSDDEHLLSLEEYAKIFCTGYMDLPPLKLGWIATSALSGASLLQDWECPRSAILYLLAHDCGFHDFSASPALSTWLEELQKTPLDNTLLERLRKAWTPKFQQVFQCLLEQNSGQTVPLLVQLRGDVLRLMAVLPKEQDNPSQFRHSLLHLEEHLRRLLFTWFSPGMLAIQRITFDTTSAGIIEKVALKEAVHPMKSLDDLRRRLGPKRRVFALFHPLLPNEPLVILHVHLETKPNHIPSCMTHVLTEDPTMQASSQLAPLVATFYSISNTQQGLTRGLGLGEFLIKQAVQQLQQGFPSRLNTFVTLSPMPGFRKWLESVVVPASDSDDDQEWAQGLANEGVIVQESIDMLASARPLLQELLLSTKVKDDNVEDCSAIVEQQLEKIKESLAMLAAYYLVLAKNPRSGKPLDPVTGFHVHNGADVFRVNVAADLSRKGLLRSLGVMVNYRYQLDRIESNKASLESSHSARLPVSAAVEELLPK